MSSLERFVSEAIKPVTATCDTARMAAGEPWLPAEFVWRGRTITVAAVIRTWRETGPCRHGSGESYVRKHWFEVETTACGIITIYFDRRPRGGQRLRDGGFSASAMRVRPGESHVFPMS